MQSEIALGFSEIKIGPVRIGPEVCRNHLFYNSWDPVAYLFSKSEKIYTKMDPDIKLKHLFKIKYGKVCNLNENEKMSKSCNEQSVSGLTVIQNRPNMIAVSSVFP